MNRITSPNPRTVAILVVIGCVLLIGCSGLGVDDSTVENNETNGTNETDGANNTTDDLAEANNTTATPEETNNTTEAEQDPPGAEDGDETNETESDVNTSSTPENASGVTETNETEETTDTDETDQSDQTDDTDEATEYASPDDIRVDGVTHMESDSDLDSDEITLANTNDELALPIGGWEIAFEGTDQRISIDEGTVIEPGDTRTIQLEDGEKVLNEDGGVVHLYDAEGNHVGSWDHVGSPSSPPASDEGDEQGYVQFEIIDAESGEGVENANVVLEDGDTQLTGSTDGAGVTTIRDISYGEYELTVEHDEYTTHSETITVNEETTERTIDLESAESEGAAAQTVTGTIGTAGV
ncbi:carboxypeptidase regulatory-like domain-containing protein [Halalkalicoccus ordinarius]|uniref:carboxypeptidase regulatory-like domain-containing protein n=1 Tax=Halalkalicoccus ordinarius TaxID=3116651 RepID=UPI00300EE759